MKVRTQPLIDVTQQQDLVDCRRRNTLEQPAPKVTQQGTPWFAHGDAALLYEFLPEDSSLQSHGLREARTIMDRVCVSDNRVTVLDLGCGAGASRQAFTRPNHSVRWLGLDLPDSPEANVQTQKPPCFCTYDGVRIPLADDSIDMVYSRQVFEHVRHPQVLLSETHRVLRKGGIFVGSTSHMEPLHSRSFWNYTPYGFCTLLREAGFQSVLVRPGIDALTLVSRRLFGLAGLSNLFAPFFTVESPVNLFLEVSLRLLGQPVKRRNYFKLVFAGHFCFLACK